MNHKKEINLQPGIRVYDLNQCFSNFLIPTPLFTPDTLFSPPSLIKQTQGSKSKKNYFKKVLKSWTKQLYYDTYMLVDLRSEFLWK